MKSEEWDSCPHRFEIGINMAKLNEKMHNVEQDVSEIKDTLNEFIKSANNKFATKEEVRTLGARFWWLIGVLITSLITSVGFLFKQLIQ